MTSNSQPQTITDRSTVAATVASHPVMAVIRTATIEQARQFVEPVIAGGVRLLEVTFSVPGALDLVAELRQQVPPECVVGMGTVTTAERARQAVDAGAAFVVSPNCSAEVADITRSADRYLVLGSLTPTEIQLAWDLGADLVKVYPLPPVGGPNYLSTVRQPLSEIPMLAGGGFPVDEIPAYREAGASAFGIGAPLVDSAQRSSVEQVQRALRLARGLDP